MTNCHFNQKTMTTPQIYATLEEAQILKNAGWEKPTHFCTMQSWQKAEECTFETEKGYGGGIHDHDIAGFLYRPTLGEIELPERLFIVKTGFGYIAMTMDYSDNVKSMSSLYYESELSARIHAWIFAKQNGLV